MSSRKPGRRSRDKVSDEVKKKLKTLFVGDKKIINGYAFNINDYTVRGDKPIALLDCLNRRRYSSTPPFLPCPARCSMDIDGKIGEVVNTHNHERVETLADDRAFHHDLKKSSSNSGENLKKIFDDTLNRHPKTQPVSYDTKKTSMHRARRKVVPPQPKNFEEYAEYLTQDQWTSLLAYNNGRLEVKKVGSDDDTSVIFYDLPYMKMTLKNVEKGDLEFSVDSTFNIIPNSIKPRQFMTVQIYKGNQAVAFMYVLMKSKKTTAYEEVFKFLFNELCPEIKELQPIVHLDFELASRNAIKKIIPDVRIQLCLFHYCQALTKNAFRLGALSKKYKKNSEVDDVEKEVEEILRKLMALAYLPATYIPGQLCRIIGKINNPEVFKRMKRFLNYYIKQWIKARTPEEWSQFHNKRKTNNATESWNRDLNSKFGKHPSIWKFTTKIVEEQNIAYREYLAIMALKKPQRGQIENRRKSSKIQDLNSQLTSGLISPSQFLEFATQLITFRRSNTDGTEAVEINDGEIKNDDKKIENRDSIDNELNLQHSSDDEEQVNMDDEEEKLEETDDEADDDDDEDDKDVPVKAEIIRRIKEAFASHGIIMTEDCLVQEVEEFGEELVYIGEEGIEIEKLIETEEVKETEVVIGKAHDYGLNEKKNDMPSTSADTVSEEIDEENKENNSNAGKKKLNINIQKNEIIKLKFIKMKNGKEDQWAMKK